MRGEVHFPAGKEILPPHPPPVAKRGGTFPYWGRLVRYISLREMVFDMRMG